MSVKNRPVKKKKPSRRKNRSKQPFDQPNEVRAIARERVGTVKSSRIIVPKAARKPKHKIPPGEEEP